MIQPLLYYDRDLWWNKPEPGRSKFKDNVDECFKPSNCSIVKILNDSELQNRYGLAMTVIGEDESNDVIEYCMFGVKNSRRMCNMRAQRSRQDAGWPHPPPQQPASTEHHISASFYFSLHPRNRMKLKASRVFLLGLCAMYNRLEKMDYLNRHASDYRETSGREIQNVLTITSYFSNRNTYSRVREAQLLLTIEQFRIVKRKHHIYATVGSKLWFMKY